MKVFMRRLYMCKIPAILLCFVLMISSNVLVLNGVTEVFGITQDEINSAKSDAEKIQKQLENVRNQISDLKAQANTTKEYINKFDGAISTLDT